MSIMQKIQDIENEGDEDLFTEFQTEKEKNKPPRHIRFNSESSEDVNSEQTASKTNHINMDNPTPHAQNCNVNKSTDYTPAAMSRVASSNETVAVFVSAKHQLSFKQERRIADFVSQLTLELTGTPKSQSSDEQIRPFERFFIDSSSMDTSKSAEKPLFVLDSGGGETCQLGNVSVGAETEQSEETGEYLDVDTVLPEPAAPDDPSKLPRKRKKANCFNCEGEHNMSDCPEPRDNNRIRRNKSAYWEEKNAQDAGRFYDDDEGPFPDVKAGALSAELREALGISERELPPWIYRMREIGYPPGHLERAIVRGSGLAFVDEPSADADASHVPAPRLNRSKIVDYPGFNSPTPAGTFDRGKGGQYNVPPIRYKHLVHNFVEAVERDLAMKHAAENPAPPPRETPVPEPTSREVPKNEDMDVWDGEEGKLLPPPPAAPSLSQENMDELEKKRTELRRQMEELDDSDIQILDTPDRNIPVIPLDDSEESPNLADKDTDATDGRSTPVSANAFRKGSGKKISAKKDTGKNKTPTKQNSETANGVNDTPESPPAGPSTASTDGMGTPVGVMTRRQFSSQSLTVSMGTPTAFPNKVDTPTLDRFAQGIVPFTPNAETPTRASMGAANIRDIIKKIRKEQNSE